MHPVNSMIQIVNMSEENGYQKSSIFNF